jgi:hypothetical protein
MSEEQIQEIQVARTSSCPSLSGRSTITYEIGSKGDSQQIRISGNSAGGLFSGVWVEMATIKPLLAGSPNVTSKTLQPVYAGKSANSPGFLLAALVHEKLCSTGKETSAPDIHPQKKPAKKVTTKKIPT